MIVLHPCPNSYTGEDLAEISCHGNPLVVDRILDLIAASGLARLAHKGEFTRRAFLNGKIDLMQAEAVGALIGSSSAAGCDLARSLLQGGLSGQVHALREGITGILAEIEASFITEDLGPDGPAILERILPLASSIDSLLQDAQDSSRIYKGIVTTIAGLPNVGKSSLFNAIIGYDRAIVHHEEGTTRDVLREHLRLDGIDFIFHDTAGIRETSSGPEQLGVEKTLQALQASDLLLYVVDAREGVRPNERQWLNLSDRTIVVMNKTDLVTGSITPDPYHPSVPVSAKLGKGIDGLMSAMSRSFLHGRNTVFLDRHAYLLRQASASLESCMKAIEGGLAPDALAIDLRQAAGCLSQMTGESLDEDILEDIFSRFCIGK